MAGSARTSASTFCSYSVDVGTYRRLHEAFAISGNDNSDSTFGVSKRYFYHLDHFVHFELAIFG